MIKNTPIYLLESLIAAAKAESFEQAADALAMTQSTLSKQMILLEELLPQKVFTFSGRKKVLTPYGKALVAALGPRLDQTQQLIDQVSKEFLEEKNVVYTIAGRGELLDPLASNLKLANQIIFKNCSNDEALHLVLSRQADLGIVHSGIDSHEIVLRPYFQNKFQVIFHQHGAKPAARSKFGEALLKLPCLLYKADDPVFIEACKELEIPHNKVHVGRIYSNYRSLIHMVESGLGWSIVPSHMHVSSSLGRLPLGIQVGSQRKFYLCYRKENAAQKWHKNLIRAVGEI